MYLLSCQHLCHKSIQIDGCEGDFDTVQPQVQEFQDASGEVHQLVNVPSQGGEVLLLLVRRVALQQVQAQIKVRNGRAQFMRDVLDKLRLQAVKLAQPFVGGGQFAGALRNPLLKFGGVTADLVVELRVL